MGLLAAVALAVTLGAASLGLAQAAAGGATTQPVRPDQHTVYIPYKDLRQVFEREGRGVYLPYEEFMRLWQEARGPAGAAEPPVPAFIASAQYKGSVKDDLATIDASYQVQVLRGGWSRLAVGLTGVATAKATLAGQPARLVARAQGGYDLLVTEPGTHALEVSFVVPVVSEPGRKSFGFGAPPVPVSQIEVDIPEKDVKVEVQPLLAATRTPVGETATRVMAFLGAADTVRVQWTPRPVDVTALAPLVFATTDTLTALEEGVMRTSVTVGVEVLRAPVATFKLALPAAVRLISIKGDNLKDWRLAAEAAAAPPAEGPARQVLTVDLHAGITGAYRLALELEQLVAAEATEVVVPEVTLLTAERETGHVAVSTAATLRSEVVAQTNLSQVDAKELPAALRSAARVAGYRYLKHPYELRLSLARISPRIEVVGVNQVTIEKDRLRLEARLSYDIAKVGVFQLRAQVPAGLEVIDVGAPGALSDFRVRPGEGGAPTVIEADLPKRTIGSFVLPISCERRQPGLAGSVALPSAEALGVDKEEGYLAVLAPEALKVVSAQATGLVPVEAAELLRQGVAADDGRGNALVFGYRYRRRPIAAAVDVSARQTKVTAEVLSLYDVARDVVHAKVTLRYTIRYAGIDTLKFQVPKAISDKLKVTGADLKEHKALPQEAGETKWVTWQVLLQGARTGTHSIAVEYDLPVAAAAGEAPTTVDLPVIRIKEADPSIERETGQLAVVKAADLGVECTPGAGLPAATAQAALEVIDPRELDPVLQRPDVVSAFKYYTSAYTLALAVKRFEFAEVATTVAAKATVESIVGKDGAVTSRARWRIKTTQRQFLEVTLPAGAVLAGVVVADRPVQPQKGRTEDAYLINLKSQISDLRSGGPGRGGAGGGGSGSGGGGSSGGSGGDESEVLVELVYTQEAPAGGGGASTGGGGAPTGAGGAPRSERPARQSARRLALAGPALPPDVPVQKLLWVLYLSADRHVGALTSDLSDETTWRVDWQHLWPRIRPTAGVHVERWIGAGAVPAATFEPPADAQAFLLSGMGGPHTVTLRTADRRLIGVAVFAVLLAVGLVFALTPTAVKMVVVVALVGLALLGAIVNHVMVLEGISAGALGFTALVAVWLLEYVFLRVPRSVRRRRLALATSLALRAQPALAVPPDQAGADADLDQLSEEGEE